MRTIALIILSSFLLASCQKEEKPPVMPDQLEAGLSTEQAEVAKAASKLLALIDSEKLEATWELASPLLRDNTNKITWIAGITAMRAAVGEKASRRVKQVGFTDRLEGAPPGEYAAIFIDTTFSRVTAEEKVVFQKHEGRWKVIGYFLSKRYSASKAGKSASSPSQ